MSDPATVCPRLNGDAEASPNAAAREFQPVPSTDQRVEDMSLSEIVYQAVGAASVAWGDDGVFDDAFARSIAEYVIRAVTGPGSARTGAVLFEVARERQRQTAKHGDQSHLPLGTGPDLILRGLPEYQSAARADHMAIWAKARCKAASQNEGGDGSITLEQILTEEWAEMVAEAEPALVRAEAIQLAAVSVQIVEAIDRRAVG